VGLAVATFATTALCSAQVRQDFVPYAGLYLPTQKVVNSASYSLSQKTNVILGFRVTAWLSNRMGIEATFGYSPSGVREEIATATADTSAFVITASAKAVVLESPPGAPTSFHFGVGVCLVNYGGAAYSDAHGTSRLGGTMGEGVALKMDSSLALRLDAELYLFKAQFNDGSGTPTTHSQFQNDFVLSVGLAVSLR
jgi:hypothetical protein